MPAEVVLSGAVAVDGAFPHARRRFHEAFPGIIWRDSPAHPGGATIALATDPAMKEGAFRV